MSNMFPSNPGFTVVYANMNQVIKTLKTNPGASLEPFVKSNEVVMWRREESGLEPVTHGYLDVAKCRYVILEHATQDEVQKKRQRLAHEIYDDVIDTGILLDGETIRGLKRKEKDEHKA